MKTYTPMHVYIDQHDRAIEITLPCTYIRRLTELTSSWRLVPLSYTTVFPLQAAGDSSHTSNRILYSIQLSTHNCSVLRSQYSKIARTTCTNVLTSPDFPKPQVSDQSMCVVFALPPHTV